MAIRNADAFELACNAKKAKAERRYQQVKRAVMKYLAQHNALTAKDKAQAAWILRTGGVLGCKDRRKQQTDAYNSELIAHLDRMIQEGVIQYDNEHNDTRIILLVDYARDTAQPLKKREPATVPYRIVRRYARKVYPTNLLAVPARPDSDTCDYYDTIFSHATARSERARKELLHY